MPSLIENLHYEINSLRFCDLTEDMVDVTVGKIIEIFKNDGTYISKHEIEKRIDVLKQEKRKDTVFTYHDALDDVKEMLK